MKALTEKDAESLGDYDEDSDCIIHFKVFRKADVLSAVALLNKTIGAEMKAIMTKPCADENIASQRTAYINGLNKASKIINECFDIQGQGTAKGKAKVQLDKLNKLDRKVASKPKASAPSSQEFPVFSDKKIQKAYEELRKSVRKAGIIKKGKGK